MPLPIFTDLGSGVYCLDALYLDPGLACCYLLDGGDEWALIETGTAHSVDNILATLAALEVPRERVRHVIPTHVHLDHAGGAGALMPHFPEAVLRIHPRGARHMIDPARLIASARAVYGDEAFAALYGEILPVDARRVEALQNKGVLSIGDRDLEVLHTPGHADHHLCLFDRRSRGWFSGDMFGVSYANQRFPNGSFVMPATTPTQFDPATYQRSVHQLAEIEPRCFYLTHFGALPFARSQAESLHRQLDAYATLGQEGPAGAGELEEAILGIAEAELCQLTDPETARTAAARLTMDAHLNAQGLAWWRKTLGKESS